MLTGDMGTDGAAYQHGPWPEGARELTLEEAAAKVGITPSDLLAHLILGHVQPSYRKRMNAEWFLPEGFIIVDPREPQPDDQENELKPTE
jgi:hypothetical protein